MTYPVQVLSTGLFAAAVLHTLYATKFNLFEKRVPVGSMRAKAFHLLGEVEVVFGVWAGVFIIAMATIESPDRAIAYIEHVDFAAPVFVFVIMVLAATRAIQVLSTRGIEFVAGWLTRLFPAISDDKAYFAVTLILGPLLGSLITEPAAMTVCALLLRERFFRSNVSTRFKYKAIGLLFVNISIGGILTHFAAPPVVMVAKIWQWDTPFIFGYFGYKAVIAVFANTLVTLFLLKSDFAKHSNERPITPTNPRVPFWITGLHILFMALVIYAGQSPSFVLGLFIFFLAMTSITAVHQDRIQIREPILVGFFLAGIIILGKSQSWWLTPFITSLSKYPLYFGATALTAFTDNAALTYLGTQIPSLSPSLKYALVAGAVTGGGLTVVANAPNPAGYGLLKNFFGEEGLHPGRLFQAALVPTVITSFCLLVL